MTHEQRTSLVAHGFDEHPGSSSEIVKVTKVKDKLQIDIKRGNQTQWVQLSFEEATELVIQLFKKILAWEAKQ